MVPNLLAHLLTLNSLLLQTLVLRSELSDLRDLSGLLQSDHACLQSHPENLARLMSRLTPISTVRLVLSKPSLMSGLAEALKKTLSLTALLISTSVELIVNSVLVATLVLVETLMLTAILLQSGLSSGMSNSVSVLAPSLGFAA